MSTCRICDLSANHKSYIAREMMFGSRDEFEYFECDRCGCIQILKFPSDLSKYYPKDYYSFQKSSVLSEERSLLTTFADRQRVKHYLGYGGWFGKFFAQRRPPLSASPGSSLNLLTWLKEAKVRLDYKIVDVGCGTGYHLLELQRNGFSKLTGIDPFIENDIFYDNGVRVFKKSPNAVEEKFDFVMLNHSFEHMQNQLSVIKDIYRILKPNRYALIRIPVASFAWRTYQTNWVQLDAPRHFFLHTVESLRLLAKQAGFELAKVVYDSTEFQLIGSEGYIRDIPMFDPEIRYIPSQKEVSAFKQKTNELNTNSDGDQACFYLYKYN